MWKMVGDKQERYKYGECQACHLLFKVPTGSAKNKQSQGCRGISFLVLLHLLGTLLLKGGQGAERHRPPPGGVASSPWVGERALPPGTLNPSYLVPEAPPFLLT